MGYKTRCVFPSKTAGRERGREGKGKREREANGKEIQREVERHLA